MQGYEYSKACFELPLGWATTWHTQFLRTLNFDFETFVDFEPKWQQWIEFGALLDNLEPSTMFISTMRRFLIPMLLRMLEPIVQVMSSVGDGCIHQSHLGHNSFKDFWFKPSWGRLVLLSGIQEHSKASLNGRFLCWSLGYYSYYLSILLLSTTSIVVAHSAMAFGLALEHRVYSSC